ncbi:unnamed protein product [Urochloa decumbens]|uniref:Acid phosphatase 1 n=1 Tax=Urochloa decumbens TaxID=240449 RepID=A0ABC9GLR0_9POAL
MAKLALLVAFLASSSSYGASSPELRGLWTRAERAVEAAAESFVEEDVAAPVIHALRPRVGSADPDPPGAIVDEAIAYTEGFKLSGNDANKKGKEKKRLWLFDIDETLLSSLPYYATHSYGESRRRCQRPETQRLYDVAEFKGIERVLLSNRKEDLRNVIEANLRLRGFSDWFKLLLKPIDCNGTAIVYKSGERKKLQDAGHVIVGSIGDQWSNLVGLAEGKRIFKLPNPLYYVR